MRSGLLLGAVLFAVVGSSNAQTTPVPGDQGAAAPPVLTTPGEGKVRTRDGAAKDDADRATSQGSIRNRMVRGFVRPDLSPPINATIQQGGLGTPDCFHASREGEHCK